MKHYAHNHFTLEQILDAINNSTNPHVVDAAITLYDEWMKEEKEIQNEKH